jgi:phosphoglycolate phosphatase-like HAD superfamily hydrolase
MPEEPAPENREGLARRQPRRLPVRAVLFDLDGTLADTAADLAAAIVGDPAWHATGPTNVTIDGRQGLRVHFAIPTSSGLGADGRFDMFALAGVPDVYGFSLGQVFDLYMVDVHGERVVIDAFHFAGTSASDLAAQQAVLDSIQIDRNP